MKFRYQGNQRYNVMMSLRENIYKLIAEFRKTLPAMQESKADQEYIEKQKSNAGHENIANQKIKDNQENKAYQDHKAEQQYTDDQQQKAKVNLLLSVLMVSPRNAILHFFSSLYQGRNFIPSAVVLVVLFITGFFIPIVYAISIYLLIAWVLLLITDIFLLYGKKGHVTAERPLPDRFSNGDENQILITIYNYYQFPVSINIIDELPYIFQKRDFHIAGNLDAGEKKLFTYTIKPVKRGAYQFGKTLVYVSTSLNLFQRRFEGETEKEVAVYPAFKSMQKYRLLLISGSRFQAGLKQVRKLGHTMEFEQIREYAPGDDYRFINWKATARRGKTMINQYRDQQEQPVYCIIDKGRMMRMPFGGMTLLDYSINATLVVSGAILQKQDKAGTALYSDRLESFLRADNKTVHLKRIMELLYKQETAFPDPDFGKVAAALQQKLNQHSLLLWFTNFETLQSLERHLPYMRMLARHHTVVVILFVNTELESYLQHPSTNLSDIYMKITAEQLAYEKRMIIRRLNRSGILTLYTRPEDLNVNLINKYLELKASGKF